MATTQERCELLIRELPVMTSCFVGRRWLWKQIEVLASKALVHAGMGGLKRDDPALLFAMVMLRRQKRVELEWSEPCKIVGRVDTYVFVQ